MFIPSGSFLLFGLSPLNKSEVHAVGQTRILREYAECIVECSCVTGGVIQRVGYNRTLTLGLCKLDGLKDICRVTELNLVSQYKLYTDILRR